MISLTNKLENTIQVVIDNQVNELPLNLYFNSVLKWYEIAENSDIELLAKLRQGWELFVPKAKNMLDYNDPDSYETMAVAMSDIIEYISEDPYADVSNRDNISDEDTDSLSSNKKWFSYSKDAEAIFASFLFDYKIDLIDEMDKMRWEKFRALFNNLSVKSPLMRIIDIRQSDPTKLKGQAQLDLIQAQQYYSLDKQADVASADEQMSGMFQMLMAQAKNN